MDSPAPLAASPPPHHDGPSAHPSPHRAADLDRIAHAVVEDLRAAPGAVVACAFRNRGAWVIAEGASGARSPNGIALTPDAPFDLASLTKPFSALALARLVRLQLVELSTPLGVLVQEAIGTPTSRVPLELLLAHRAGLDGHRPLYAPLECNAPVDRYLALQEAASARRSDCVGDPPPQGFPPTYSDLGYLLLGQAMARASAKALDAIVASEVCAPFGLQVASARQWRARNGSFDELVVPTEHVAWRGGVVRGAVHDENAWALAGYGTCAHAGLFGTARDVARIGAAILDVLQGREDAWLRPAELEPLVRVRPGGTLRAGFDGKSPSVSSAGSVCSKETFGHLGFTGTSVWIDPVAQTVAVLLTNRVHPTRAHEAIKQARPAAHDALFRWAAVHASVI